MRLSCSVSRARTLPCMHLECRQCDGTEPAYSYMADTSARTLTMYEYKDNKV